MPSLSAIARAELAGMIGREHVECHARDSHFARPPTAPPAHS